MWCGTSPPLGHHHEWKFTVALEVLFFSLDVVRPLAGRAAGDGGWGDWVMLDPSTTARHFSGSGGEEERVAEQEERACGVRVMEDVDGEVDTHGEAAMRAPHIQAWVNRFRGRSGGGQRRALAPSSLPPRRASVHLYRVCRLTVKMVDAWWPLLSTCCGRPSDRG